MSKKLILSDENIKNVTGGDWTASDEFCPSCNVNLMYSITRLTYYCPKCGCSFSPSTS